MCHCDSLDEARLLSVAAANVFVGYGVGVLIQMLVFPVFGLTVTVRQNLTIGLVFTAVSIVRWFNSGVFVMIDRSSANA